MVRIQPQSPDHAEGLFAALSDAGSYARLDEAPPTGVEEMRARIVRLAAGPPPGAAERWLNWTVFDGRRVVGYTQATVGAGGAAAFAIVLHPGAWGRSVGYRAGRLTLDVLWADAGVRRIVADAAVGNLRSRALLERLGFARTHVEGGEAFYVQARPRGSGPRA